MIIDDAREKARQAWDLWRNETDKKRKAQLFHDFQEARKLLFTALAADFHSARAELLQPYIPR